MKNSNNIKAFEEAIREYGSLITRLCWYYSRSRDEFEDLQQDTLLNIWRGWDSFHGAANRKTWIYRVCLNTCISSLRRYKNMPRYTELTELTDVADTPDEADTAREEVHTLLKGLPPTDRVLMLLYLEARPYEEIAEIMGMPRNTVATRLRRAKEKMARIAQSINI